MLECEWFFPHVFQLFCVKMFILYGRNGAINVEIDTWWKKILLVVGLIVGGAITIIICNVILVLLGLYWHPYTSGTVFQFEDAGVSITINIEDKTVYFTVDDIEGNIIKNLSLPFSYAVENNLVRERRPMTNFSFMMHRAFWLRELNRQNIFDFLMIRIE